MNRRRERPVPGILIEYDYSGDEAAWQNAVNGFVKNVEADARLNGRFSYQVNIKKDGVGRVHYGQWDNEETLAHLQGQAWFKDFAGMVRDFAGGPPKNDGLNCYVKTAGLAE